jgi:hypothetical protein
MYLFTSEEEENVARWFTEMNLNGGADGCL